MDNIEEIKIRAPGPKLCPRCATAHAPGQPHDRDSLYYQNWFYKRNKRFPTWTDAMAHCTEKVKAEYSALLSRRGIAINAPALLRKAEAPAAPGWNPQDSPGLVAPADGNGATAAKKGGDDG